MTMKLIVSVDTEEEGVWDRPLRSRGNTVENVSRLVRFQALCDRFGIRPTYLADAPVVQDAASVELLRALQADGRCEIGAHVHPWCNPPIDDEFDTQTSYLCNLPESLQRDKITWITEAIEQQFGRRPTSFRAGRYGMGIAAARILSELGYCADSSVLPFTDYSGDGGPNFEHAPYRPYFVDGDDLCAPHSAGTILEIPVTVGFNRGNFERANSLRQFASRPRIRKLRAVGILDRLGIVRRIKFSPEQAGAADMKRLVENASRLGLPCVVMMLHSSSLMPGGSPYVPDQRALDRFEQRLADVFDHCVHRRQMDGQTISEFTQSYRGGLPSVGEGETVADGCAVPE